MSSPQSFRVTLKAWEFGNILLWGFIGFVCTFLRLVDRVPGILIWYPDFVLVFGIPF
jgi:hypothetical protein|uniref:Uncharacterized protein n=1 Tax=Picea glauca TaxID=3330 RepID=A0A124GMR2_PICGL|nr:hypothetical protein ABT39_MTgene1594 [Picea glauca]